MRWRFASASVARLGTVRPDGRPHLVPVCFALDGDVVVSVVDDKPKRSTRLRRFDNVRANPAVSLMVDHYDDDWTQLWWVRVDGTARVLEAGTEHARAIDLLVAKYAQYRALRPAGSVLVIAVEAWRVWSAR
ncbi:MAG TPA: TIGR03668 family PPOX class F420-dependent oxidoreductase [Xanthomonadales bacterium]|nr:TIGR03668 family PPOX class F420-dependent oxidoreductase [Xanthomonadales bacterium]